MQTLNVTYLSRVIIDTNKIVFVFNDPNYVDTAYAICNRHYNYSKVRIACYNGYDNAVELYTK